MGLVTISQLRNDGAVDERPTGSDPEEPADVPVIDVLVVDGANVVGSRPDGWWNDRAGAAARLHARLLAVPGLAERIVLVLEGRARPGAPATRSGLVEVTHAPGEGDDAIVREARLAIDRGRAVAVVTADRALAARIEGIGGRVLRPTWLLGRLDASDPDARTP